MMDKVVELAIKGGPQSTFVLLSLVSLAPRRG